jgi:hypothetical protein
LDVLKFSWGITELLRRMMYIPSVFKSSNNGFTRWYLPLLTRCLIVEETWQPDWGDVSEKSILERAKGINTCLSVPVLNGVGGHVAVFTYAPAGAVVLTLDYQIIQITGDHTLFDEIRAQNEVSDGRMDD